MTKFTKTYPFFEKTRQHELLVVLSTVVIVFGLSWGGYFISERFTQGPTGELIILFILHTFGAGLVSLFIIAFWLEKPFSKNKNSILVNDPEHLKSIIYKLCEDKNKPIKYNTVSTIYITHSLNMFEVSVKLPHFDMYFPDNSIAGFEIIQDCLGDTSYWKNGGARSFVFSINLYTSNHEKIKSYKNIKDTEGFLYKPYTKKLFPGFQIARGLIS